MSTEICEQPPKGQEFTLLSVDSHFLYVFGGRNSGEESKKNSERSATIWCYNLLNNSWSNSIHLDFPSETIFANANTLKACSATFPAQSAFLFGHRAETLDPEEQPWKLYLISLNSENTRIKPSATLESIEFVDADKSAYKFFLFDSIWRMHLATPMASADTNEATTLFVLGDSVDVASYVVDEPDDPRFGHGPSGDDGQVQYNLFVFKLAKGNAGGRTWMCITPKPYRVKSPSHTIAATLDDHKKEEGGGQDSVEVVALLGKYMDAIYLDDPCSFVHQNVMYIFGRGRSIKLADEQRDMERQLHSFVRNKLILCHLADGLFELATISPDPLHGFPPYRISGQRILLADSFYLLPGEDYDPTSIDGDFIYSATIWRLDIAARKWQRLDQLSELASCCCQMNPGYSAIAGKDENIIFFGNDENEPIFLRMS